MQCFLGCFEHYPGGRCGWLPADRSMRSNRVVVNAPLFYQNACFIEAVEQLSIQELVAELAIEAFTVTILPRTARFDVSSLGTNGL